VHFFFFCTANIFFILIIFIFARVLHIQVNFLDWRNFFLCVFLCRLGSPKWWVSVVYYSIHIIYDQILLTNLRYIIRKIIFV
jgi:hypothetical protein